jgi:hypothetical protein
MIDETAIRTALEVVLGDSFRGFPVSRIGEASHGCDPHVRTYFVCEPRTELYRGIRRLKGMLGILVHVPVNDGIAAAETIATQIPPLFRSDETANATVTTPGGIRITIREVSMMSAYRGVDEDKTDAPQWLVVPVQIDWRVDITR